LQEENGGAFTRPNIYQNKFSENRAILEASRHDGRRYAPRNEKKRMSFAAAAA
jgi:hypothetical protein